MAQIPLQEKQLRQQMLTSVLANDSGSHTYLLSKALCNVSGSIVGTTPPTAVSSCLLQLQPPPAAMQTSNETGPAGPATEASAMSFKPPHILRPHKPQQLHSTRPPTQPVPILARHNPRQQQQQLLLRQLQQQQTLQQANAATALQSHKQASASGSMCSKLSLQVSSPPISAAAPTAEHLPIATASQAGHPASLQQHVAQVHTHCYNTRVQEQRQQLLQLLQHQRDQVCNAAAAVKLRLSGAQQQRQQLPQQHATAAAAARAQSEEAVAAVSARSRGRNMAAAATASYAGHAEQAAAAISTAVAPEGGHLAADIVADTHEAECQAPAAATHYAEQDVDEMCIDDGKLSSTTVINSTTDCCIDMELDRITDSMHHIAARASKRRHRTSSSCCSSRTALIVPPTTAMAAELVAGDAPFHQAILLQLLCKAAAARKGTAALTADSGAAAAAGAASARGRLLITELTVYSKHAKQLQRAVIGRAGPSCGCSAADLQIANRLMANITLPDGVVYMPVQPDSRIFCSGASWRIPAFAICLASSYMQRLMVKQPCLAAAAAKCVGFQDYAHHLPPQVSVPHLSSDQAADAVISLRIAKCICLFLALKVADSVHALGLLRFMISQVTGSSAPSQSDVEAYETTVLDLLDWRLGPFFAETADVQPGRDELMWAEAVVQCWDY